MFALRHYNCYSDYTGLCRERVIFITESCYYLFFLQWFFNSLSLKKKKLLVSRVMLRICSAEFVSSLWEGLFLQHLWRIHFRLIAFLPRGMSSIIFVYFSFGTAESHKYRLCIWRVATVYLGKSEDEKWQTIERTGCITDSSKIFDLLEKIISFFLCVPCVVPDRILPANYFSLSWIPRFQFSFERWNIIS